MEGIKTKVAKPGSVTKEATGSGTLYSEDPRTLVTELFFSRVDPAAKQKFYDTLKTTGVGVEGTEGMTTIPKPTPGVKGMPKAEPLDGVSRETHVFLKTKDAVSIVDEAGNPKHRKPAEGIWIPKDVAREVESAGRRGPVVAKMAWADLATRLQLAGIKDALSVVGRVMTEVGGLTPGAGAGTLGRILPAIDSIVAHAKLTWNAGRRYFKGAREADRSRQTNLARIGAMNPTRSVENSPEPVTRWWQVFRKANKITSDFGSAVESEGRLMLDRAFDKLVEAGRFEDTDTNRREFVNRISQPVGRAMDMAVRWMRDRGLIPYIRSRAAGANQRVRLITQNPYGAARPKTIGDAVKMRAEMLFRQVSSTILLSTIWNVANGRGPFGRPGVPFGAMDIGGDDENPRYIHPLNFFLGTKRALGAAGLQAVAQFATGKSSGRRLGVEMQQGAVDAFINPWLRNPWSDAPANFFLGGPIRWQVGKGLYAREAPVDPSGEYLSFGDTLNRLWYATKNIWAPGQMMADAVAGADESRSDSTERVLETLGVSRDLLPKTGVDAVKLEDAAIAKDVDAFLSQLRGELIRTKPEFRYKKLMEETEKIKDPKTRYRVRKRIPYFLARLNTK